MADEEKRSSYEFSAAENEVIGNLAQGMLTVGLVLMILGVVGFAASAVSFLSAATAHTLSFDRVLESLFLLGFGYWTRDAGQAFDAVVQTKGADIPHLMRALGHLGRMYGIIRILVLVVVVLAVGLAVAAALGAPLVLRRFM